MVNRDCNLRLRGNRRGRRRIRGMGIMRIRRRIRGMRIRKLGRDRFCQC